MYVISAFGVILVLVGWAIGDEPGGSWWLAATGVLVAAVGVVGARLTVTVDDRAVTASFGWGWPRRRIEIDQIDDVVAVRNSWWNGWGIRKVSRGWMYNNAGRDAIEVKLRSGRVFRIGTDEPIELLAALQRSRQRA